MTPTLTSVTTAAPWFRIDRHDVRSTLPAGVRAIMQNGLLDRTFQEALVPSFLFPAIADTEPWTGGLGDTKTFTRTGLLTPKDTPITGSDPSPSTYSIEQWSVTMDQYADSVDTNMLQSKMTLASKWLEDCQKLGIGAGQSINRIARNKLYKAYAGGRTYCTTAGTSDTSIVVASTDGFESVLVNGVPTPVSGANALDVTIAGTANTVTGVNTTTRTLTLGTARADTAGDYVLASNAPVSIRPGTASSAYDLTSGNVATFAMFRAAVARLRRMNVPTIRGGVYVAHIDSDTEAELFNDSQFQLALQGRVDSPVDRDMSIGQFGGLDWVKNEEVPTLLGGSSGTLTVHRPIVYGANALVAAPLEDQANLLSGTGVEAVPEIRSISPAPGVDVQLIIRPPQDRLQQVISSSWAWTGDYGVPSDSSNGDSALFKRAVVLEHA